VRINSIVSQKIKLTTCDVHLIQQSIHVNRRGCLILSALTTCKPNVTSCHSLCSTFSL